MDKKQKLIRMCISFLPLLLLLMDTPQGMDPKAWHLFPYYIGAILMVMLQPVGEATALLIMIGLYAVMQKGQAVALSGFSNNMVWLVVGAYIVAQAFKDTNLGSRISYWMIKKFGRSSLGLGYAAAFSDLVIAPVTPSNAARTGGIIWPIFKSISESLGSTPENNPRGIGAYLSFLLYIVTMCTGITFLTGYAANTVTWVLADQMLGLKLSWLEWTTAFCVPAMTVMLLAPWLLHKIYKPTIDKIDGKRIGEEGLAKLGPMSGKEILCVVLFLGCIVLWATSKYTKINATAVLLGFIAIALATGILSFEKMATNRSIWNTLMWYGGIIGLATALNKFKFFAWCGKELQLLVDFSQFNHITLLILLVVIGTSCRYLFVSCGAYMASVIPIQFTIGLAAGLPAYDMFLVFLMCGVMGAILTHYANAAGPALYGAGYENVQVWLKLGIIFVAISYVIFAVIGVPYWMALGIFTSL